MDLPAAVEFCARSFDRFRPALHLLLDEVRELGLGHLSHCQSEVVKSGDKLRVVERCLDRRMQPLQNGRRQFSRRGNADEVLRQQVWKAGLDHGRNFGRNMRARSRSYGERAQFLGFDVRHVLRQRVEGEAQPAGDQVGDHRRAALITDVLDVETQLLLEGLAENMSDRADPARAVEDLLVLRLYPADEFSQVLGGNRWMGHHHIRNRCDEADVGEALDGIVRLWVQHKGR